jgi:hypothetical protein
VLRLNEVQTRQMDGLVVTLLDFYSHTSVTANSGKEPDPLLCQKFKSEISMIVEGII